MAVVPNEPRPPWLAIAAFTVGAAVVFASFVATVCGFLIGLAGIIGA